MIIDAVVENAGEVIKLVSEESDIEKLSVEITIIQAVELAEIINKTNYEVLEKKVKSLLKKMGPSLSQFPLGRPSQPSVSGIQDIDLSTSSKEVGEKEELPMDRH